MNKKEDRRIWLAVFLLNFLCAACALLPHAFANGGILTLCEDFNAETLPYYQLMNGAVRSGEVFWNWNIDIGSEFGTAFGIRIFSPFTWPALLVPQSWVPYVAVWILILKFTAAGMTSYLYISQYVRNKECAVIGSLLYAFSGIQIINTVFNLFDCVIFFPLMLYTLDKLVLEDRRGGFALAVFANVCVGFVFFVQSALLTIMYFIVRFWIGDRNAWRHIGKCMLEAILGIGIASFAFVPQLISMLGNTRAQVKLEGSRYLSFSTGDILQLVGGWLLPASVMSNCYAIGGIDWSSNCGYLPVVGIMVPMAFGRANRKHWLTRGMIVCLLFMSIPVLNSVFTLGSSFQYRRWFYFPVILGALATSMFIDKGEEEGEHSSLWRESFVTLGLIIAFTVFAYYVNWDGQNNHLVHDVVRMNWNVGVACIGIIVMMAIWKFAKKPDRGLLTLVCVLVMSSLLLHSAVGDYQLPSDHGVGENRGNAPQTAYNEVYRTTDVMEGIKVWPYRMVSWNDYYNYNMVIQQPARMSFHSLVDNSISELYEMLGTPRSSAMTPFGPRGTDELLSTRYFMLNYDLDTLTKVKEADNGNYLVRLYEDPDALPLGFTYEYYMPRSEFVTYPSDVRATVMMRALVVKDEDVDQVSSVLTHYDPVLHGIITLDGLKQYQKEHLQESGNNHQRNNRGDFSFNVHSSADKYCFVSVPYSKKWKATVNGEDAEILNINGLMAVRVSEGENTVAFRYSMIINRICVVMSVVFIVVFVAYVMIYIKKRKTILL